MIMILPQWLHLGLDKGLLGMCLGEKRRIKVPPQLGYGDKGHPPKIPGKTGSDSYQCWAHSSEF